MNLPKHPGTITFIDGASERVEQASAVPESIRFSPDKNGKLVPVVRVVAYTQGSRRVIREYGVDGTELRSTVQIRER